MSDAPNPRARWRVGLAVALLLVGLLGAVIPALAAGTAFLPDERVYQVDGSKAIPMSFAKSAPTPVECRFTGETYSVGPTPGGMTINGRGRVTLSIIAPWTSADWLVLHDARWTSVAAAFAIAPLLFLWWRRAAWSFGRVAGIACCAAGGVSVCAIVLLGRDEGSRVVGGTWWTVPLGAAVMLAAFVVAPAPRVRDE